jgi:glycosyltransferase involved in cell wall biosynthesis
LAEIGIGVVTVKAKRAGGAEVYARNLIKGLQASDIHRFHILANVDLADDLGPLVPGSVSMHALRSFSPKQGSGRHAAALARAALHPGPLRRELPPRLAMVHFPIVVPVPRVKLPTVITLHDTLHHDFPEYFSHGSRMYRRLAYDLPAKRAARVITVSHFSRQRIIEALNLAPESVHVIHLGIDSQKFQPAEPGGPIIANDMAIADHLGLPDRYLFYPAALWPHKNHERLVRAFAAVADPSLHLVLTGQPHGTHHGLERIVGQLRISDRVHYLGYVEDHLVPAIFRNAIALVFPSLYEGFGMPPLEAMACGCPALVSSAGAIPEVCGNAALLLDPYDIDAMRYSIENVAGNETLRTHLIDRGLLRAAEFNWERTALAHEQLYDQVLQGSR